MKQSGSGRRRQARNFSARVLRRLPYFGQLDAAPEDRLNGGDHVRSLGQRNSSLLEQSVCSFTAWVKGRAGHRKDLAALFSSQSGRDQRARPSYGLNDDDADRKTGNQPVKARKVVGARLPPKWNLRNSSTVDHERVDQFHVLGRGNTTLGLVGGGRFRADFSFAAIQKARDVRTMHEPQQNGEQQK